MVVRSRFEGKAIGKGSKIKNSLMSSHMASAAAPPHLQVCSMIKIANPDRAFGKQMGRSYCVGERPSTRAR